MNKSTFAIVKNSITAYGVYPIVFAVGMSIGTVLGRLFIGLLLFSNERNIPLLYRPANEYLQLAHRIANLDEYNRITSYYLLHDVNRIDVEFLIERYQREELLHIRRTILWIIGGAGRSTAALGFFNDIYPGAPVEIQREILRSLKRMDTQAYHEFIARWKIPPAAER